MKKFKIKLKFQYIYFLAKYIFKYIKTYIYIYVCKSDINIKFYTYLNIYIYH